MKILNRKANFNYRILETLECGVVLSGAEVKAVRLGRADLSEGFARVMSNEVYLKNVYIFDYTKGGDKEYQERRDRKLLLHRAQIDDLRGRLSKGGMALLPLSIYLKRNLVKVQLGLGQSKSKSDKRRDIKEKDQIRQLEQDMDNYQ